MSNLNMSKDELDSVLHWRGKHAQVVRERDALQLLLNAADQRNDDLTVPPAGGEVEVLAWAYKRHDQSPYGKPSQHIALASENLTAVREGLVGVGIACDNHFDWQPLVNRTHVTRLQAEVELWRTASRTNKDSADQYETERDGLKAEVERLAKTADTAEWELSRVNEHNAVMQSELAKARELLDDIPSPYIAIYWKTWRAKVKAFLAHQSAPAAKGEE